jgi:lipid A 3-O-deacylase
MLLRMRILSANFLCIASVILLQCSNAGAAVDSIKTGLWGVINGSTPHEEAVGIYGGTAYDWSRMSFCLVNFQRLYKYSDVCPHNTPDRAKMKFEFNIGAAEGSDFPGQRIMVSGDILSVYEFDSPKNTKIVPYIEGGVGLIYSDFQRPDQGLRFNFNPVAGAGLRMGSKYIVVRLHHISNGGTNDNNRGVNSIMLGVGAYFN